MEHIIDKLDTNAAHGKGTWYFPAESTTQSLREIRLASLNMASVLQKHGVGGGDRVALMLGNSSDYVAALLAIWRLNAIAVPLRPQGSRQTNYADYVRQCDAVCDFSLCIHDDNMEPCGTIPKTMLTLQVLAKGSSNGDIAAGETNISPHDVAVLQFSSGSTGAPKGVIVTHGMLMQQLQNILYNHIVSRRGCPIESLASWMPFNHDMGLFIGVLTPIYTGCDNLLAPPGFYMRNPPRWFELMAKYQVDMNFSTNSVLASTLHTLRRLHRLGQVVLPQLHLYIGAEKVSPLIVRRCHEMLGPLGVAAESIHIGYGMAENALGAACTKRPTVSVQHFRFVAPNRVQPCDEHLSIGFDLVAVGSPDWRHRITVRDRGDRILPELSLGEINIESPCVTPGYYGDTTTTRDKLVAGRLRTGDLGFFYAGELYFYARQDDMIVVAGRNVIPDDVEMAVEDLDFVRPGASILIGYENSETGCTDVALLVEISRSSSSQQLATYRHALQARALEAADLIINHIVFCERGTVEKTSSGKKRRKVVRDRLLQGLINISEACHEKRAAV